MFSLEPRECEEISENYSGHASQHCTARTHSRTDQNPCAYQADQTFENQVDPENAKRIGTLNRAPTRAQRNIKSRSQGEYQDQMRVRQIQIRRNKISY